jgi:hypothetical protein
MEQVAVAGGPALLSVAAVEPVAYGRFRTAGTYTMNGSPRGRRLGDDCVTNPAALDERWTSRGAGERGVHVRYRRNCNVYSLGEEFFFPILHELVKARQSVTSFKTQVAPTYPCVYRDIAALCVWRGYTRQILVFVPREPRWQ